MLLKLHTVYLKSKCRSMALNTITPQVLAYKPPHPKLEEFVPDRDRALYADPTKAALFAESSAVEEVTPYIGTELKGLQLSKLSDVQKDELALLVAEVRGVKRLLAHEFDGALIALVERCCVLTRSRYHS